MGTFSVELDLSARVGYITLSDNPVARTVEYSSSLWVDLDALDMVVGIEILAGGNQTPFAEVARPHHIRPEAEAWLQTLPPDLIAAYSMRSGFDGTTAHRPSLSATAC